MQVLQTATLNPAIVMKLLSDYGTVESEIIADLLQLDADPTRASSALHRIDHVILHGKPLDKAALTGLLQKTQAEAENN